MPGAGAEEDHIAGAPPVAAPGETPGLAVNGSATPGFSGRLGIQQRVLPAYRAPFFDLLAASCPGGLGVFAGLPVPEENVLPAHALHAARLFPARNVNLFPFRWPIYQCWQANLLGWLETWQPDVLVLEANARYPANRLAVRWMHRRGRPVLGWGLGAPAIHGRFAAWRTHSRLRLLRSFDGLIAYSRKGAAEYQAAGIPPGRIFLAPNAAAPRPTRPPPARPDPAGMPVTLLFVGRLQARKRLDDLLRACANLPPELQPEVHIVGDGPARPDLEALAQSIYPRARFFGARHGAELDALFAGADLFVLPGTGGLAVQQAMASGLPVIVAEGDGTQGELVGADNGWLIAPNDPTALQHALLQALSDPPRLRRMGAASYRIVAQHANLESMAAGFLRAVEQIAALPLR